ncbi:MAG: lysophospholipid acyltransferase family protein [Alysiella sp.]|uniref:lysophospholipid acyltransferase family protein n=1 Tax=Alysiella sp. TaxID=1872483 RepID=UPI0026DBE45A|nr:lysophospholipid acyltransferase family protein [Alysiella sp.]MDO4434122.1 lysophospholipid acyltransferase family protein [Alysiella sp.]
MAVAFGNGRKTHEKLDYVRRFCATLFGFVLFGLGGLAFKLVLLPYTINSTQNDISRQLQARRKVAGIWQLFVRYLIWSGVLSVEYHGMDKLGRVGQLILPNHPSLLDMVLLISQVPEINCVVKKDLLNNPTMNSQIRATGYIPNEENEAMLDEIHRVFQNNQSLLIFPEGTRTGWDGQVKMHRGAVSIGLRSAKVITPVYIKMNPPNFKKGQAWYRIPHQKIHYTISVGEDINPQTWLAEKPLPIAARRLNQYLEDDFTRKTT